ncbi:YtxH domain-containing protein, partial [Dysosmobacter welbionis]
QIGRNNLISDFGISIHAVLSCLNDGFLNLRKRLQIHICNPGGQNVLGSKSLFQFSWLPLN